MDSSFKKSVTIFLIAGSIQAFHMVEHVLQILQKYVFQLASYPGLLGRNFDIEPLHFTYNLIFLALIFLGFRYMRISGYETSKFLKGTVLFVLVFQSWHFFEHSVKLYQHFTHGCASCSGIIGMFVDVVALHFIYNLVVFSSIVVVTAIVARDLQKKEQSRKNDSM